MAKTKKNGLRFSIVDQRAPWDTYFMSLDIENFLSVSRVQNSINGCRIGLLNILLKKNLFFKFLNLSTGLPQRQLPPTIAARWRYRIAIKNLTAHYNSWFCVSFYFCFAQEA